MLKIELHYNLEISLLGDSYPKKMKALSLRNNCTPMFIAALFMVAKI